MKRNLTVLLFAALLLGAAWGSVNRATAQEPLTLPAEPGDGASGFTTFQARCANCHGPQGMGNGELAAQLPAPPKPIGTADYLADAVPADMYDIVSNGRLEAGMPPFGSVSTNPLSVQERWNAIAAVYSLGTSADSIAAGEALAQENDLVDRLAAVDWVNTSNSAAVAALSDTGLDDAALVDVVNYGRSLSYGFLDVAELSRPLPTARIIGDIINGTTGETIPELSVTAQGYDAQFRVQETITGTVDANGTFIFELTDVPQDWVYLVFTDYEGVNYSSDVVRFTPGEPQRELPITVFETTTDAADVEIDRLHVIVDFAEDAVTVNQFYGFSNLSNAVYVGSTGTPSSPTIEIMLPAGAQNPVFRRSLGNDFVPAAEVVPTETGWADTLPLRPGLNTLGLLVQYSLPYDGELTIAHPLAYRATELSLVMPDVGVTASGEQWLPASAQDIQGQSFLNYEGLASDTVAVTLEGEPRVTTTTTGSIAPRNESAELLLGSGALILAVAASAFFINQWRSQPPPDPNELVAAIAELDDAYAAGDINQRAYISQREQLKNQLRNLWAK